MCPSQSVERRGDASRLTAPLTELLPQCCRLSCCFLQIVANILNVILRYLPEVLRLHPDRVDVQIWDVDVARRRRTSAARQGRGCRPELVPPTVGQREGVAALADAGKVI